jgi:nitrosocyanin
MKTLVFLFCIAFSFSAFSETRKYTLVNYETDGVKQWLPGTIVAKKGDDIEITLINNVPSGDHSFFINEFKVREVVAKGKKKVVKFKADKAGLFEMTCFMHPAHIGGQLLILE